MPPGEAWPQNSNLTPNLRDGLNCRTALVSIRLESIKTPIQFSFFIIREWQCTLVSRDTVPEFFNKLDSLVYRQITDFYVHRLAPVKQPTKPLEKLYP